METIHTIETDDLTAKLNKSEIDIIQFIESWLPTFDRWSTKELSYKCQLSEEDGNAAADMLIPAWADRERCRRCRDGQTSISHHRRCAMDAREY